jgi:hypothetical protein
MKWEEVRGEIIGFYLRFCERYPLGVRKDTFWRVKAYLLACKRIAFEGQNGEEKNNIEDLLDKRKVPENLQTPVSSEYQALMKGPQNSRISDRKTSW